MTRPLLKSCFIAMAFLAAASAKADWELNGAQSKLAFVSVKNDSAAELSEFEELSGKITKSGEFNLKIGLDSVQTHIDIRNERMREFLFNTDQFPLANISGSLAEDTLKTLKVGQVHNVSVDLTVDLHGKSQVKTAQLQAVKLDDARLWVVTAQPLILNAAEFALQDGIDKLQELAGLSSIDSAVPVTVSLFFDLK